MNLLLVRHGEIPSNIKKVYAGKSSESLTERGILQAIEVSEQLKKHEVHALYSSPIQRAIQTAQIIGKEIGMDLRIEYAFRELEMGPWEGMTEQYIADHYPDEWKRWQNVPAELNLPERETLDELLKRVLTGIGRIISTLDGRNVVVVTHVAIIRVLLLWHEKKSLNLYKTIHVPNAQLFKLKIEADSFI